MAKAVTRYANTKRSAEAVTMVIGCLTFFDDVASAFITGTTMRDLTGLHKISREKLSFLGKPSIASQTKIDVVPPSGYMCGYCANHDRRVELDWRRAVADQGQF